jgi:hypothetical protein
MSAPAAGIVSDTDLPPARRDLVRVYVWQLPVRITHWLIAGSILVLSVTGFYIGTPFIIVSGPAGQHFVMGTIKVIHYYAAIVFTLAVGVRLLWMFMGNKYSRWDKFLPVRERRLRGCGQRSGSTSSCCGSRRASSGTTRSRGSPTSRSSRSISRRSAPGSRSTARAPTSMRTRTAMTTLTTLVAGLLATPAFAHPGHGMRGWLHHGEPLMTALVATAVFVVLGIGAAARARCPRDRRRHERWCRAGLHPGGPADGEDLATVGRAFGETTPGRLADHATSGSHRPSSARAQSSVSPFDLHLRSRKSIARTMLGSWRPAQYRTLSPPAWPSRAAARRTSPSASTGTSPPPTARPQVPSRLASGGLDGTSFSSRPGCCTGRLWERGEEAG